MTATEYKHARQSLGLKQTDLAIDADAVIDDAYRLGKEIARRWNSFNAKSSTQS